MANEITLTASLSVVQSSTTGFSHTFSKQLTLAGDESIGGTMTATQAADVALPLSTLESTGQLIIKNDDPTNYVNLSSGTGGSFAGGIFAKIRPGCFLLMEPTAATIYAKANTADCLITFGCVEA